MIGIFFTAGHLILTVTFGFWVLGPDFFDLNIHFQSFEPMVGDDELFWLNASYDAAYSRFNGVYLWPYLLWLWGLLGGTSFFSIAALKGLFYCLIAVYFLNQVRLILGKLEYFIVFAFLLFHPYIIFLHSTLMRDDLIFSVGLVVLLWFARYPELPSLKSILSDRVSQIALVSLLLLFELRPMLGYIAIFTFFILMLRSHRVLAIVPLVACLWYVSRYLTFDFQFSIANLIFNFYKMLFSPNLISVLTGQLDVVGSGVRYISVYASIAAGFNLCVFCAVIVCLFGNVGFVRRRLFNFSPVLLYCSLILVGLCLVKADVQGPRQALLATSGLFIFFVSEFLTVIIKSLFVSRRGSQRKVG